MFIGIINPVGIITFSGIVLSVLACILSFYNRFELAVICLIYAGIFDLFDGFVARKLNLNEEEKEFGVQIDTIADIVSFGITPVIILLHSGFNLYIDFLLMIIYVLCAAMRLAYFNIHGTFTKEDTTYYAGLPVTYIALFLPLIFILKNYSSPALFKNIIRVLIGVTSFLFVFNIPIPKPKGIWYLIFPLIAVVMTIYWVIQIIT